MDFFIPYYAAALSMFMFFGSSENQEDKSEKERRDR